MRRRHRFEHLEKRNLLAAGLIPLNTTVPIAATNGDLQVNGSAVLRFDAVVLNPELNGPEDVNLTNVEFSSTGQVTGTLSGLAVSGSWQTSAGQPELDFLLDPPNDVILVETVGPNHLPGTFQGTAGGVNIENGAFTAILGSNLDLSARNLEGAVSIDVTGTLLGQPISENFVASFDQADVVPGGLALPDPSLSSVSGRAFSDDNGDGIRDLIDDAATGLTAVLLQNSTEVESMQVDDDGFYGFYNLVGDGYQIRFDGIPVGRELTLLNVGSDPTVDSDVDPQTGVTAVLDFSSDSTQLNIDVGIRDETVEGSKSDTIGLYQPDISLFHLKESFTPGASDQYFAFGPQNDAGWIPLTGDWNGDGIDTIGLYQPDISLFHLKDSFTPGASDQYFVFGPGGNAGWIPLAGDWNGDGTDTIGLYQPDISLFHLKDSFTPGASDQYFGFGPGGNAGWIPLAGDWNGDGTDTIGLYQPDISLFHLKDSFTPGASDQYFGFGPGGNAGWTPLAGDWNGDGTDTIGLYQPDVSLFHLKDSFTPGASDQYFGFGPGGNAGWIPLAGDWNGPEAVVAPPPVAQSNLASPILARPADAKNPSGINGYGGVDDVEVKTASANPIDDQESGDLLTEDSTNSESGQKESGSAEGSPLQLLDDILAAW